MHIALYTVKYLDKFPLFRECPLLVMCPLRPLCFNRGYCHFYRFFTKKELFLVVLFEILVQSHIPANPESCRTSPWNWVPKLNVLLMMHYSLFVAIIYVTLWFRSYQRTYQRPKRNCSVVIHQCSTLYVWRSGLSVLFSNTFQVTEALVLANTRGIRER